ncbi:MAG: hypothetical protein V2A56_09700 [bacterium]
MGGSFALIAGFIGLVGLGVMIGNLKVEAFDPVGGVLFGLMLVNGLYAVYLRVTGRERKKKKWGPLSR